MTQVWLSQAQMADLFEIPPHNITIHIGNVYKEGDEGLIQFFHDFDKTYSENSQIKLPDNFQISPRT